MSAMRCRAVMQPAMTLLCGAALAVLRSGYQPGTARLKVTAEGVGEASIEVRVR